MRFSVPHSRISHPNGKVHSNMADAKNEPTFEGDVAVVFFLCKKVQSAGAFRKPGLLQTLLAVRSDQLQTQDAAMCAALEHVAIVLSGHKRSYEQFSDWWELWYQSRRLRDFAAVEHRLKDIEKQMNPFSLVDLHRLRRAVERQPLYLPDERKTFLTTCQRFINDANGRVEALAQAHSGAVHVGDVRDMRRGGALRTGRNHLTGQQCASETASRSRPRHAPRLPAPNRPTPARLQPQREESELLARVVPSPHHARQPSRAGCLSRGQEGYADMRAKGTGSSFLRQPK